MFQLLKLTYKKFMEVDVKLRMTALFVAILAPVLLTSWAKDRELRGFKQALRNADDTIMYMSFDDGSIRAKQTVMDNRALKKEVKMLTVELSMMARMLKNVKPKVITKIVIKEIPKETAVEREAPVPESESVVYSIKNDFVKLRFKTPEAEVLEIEHAPIELSLVEGKKGNSRVMFAVAKNMWSGEVIKELQVERLVLEAPVFKPYYLFQVGNLNTTVYGSVFRYRKEKRAFGLSMGYNLVDQDYKIGVSYQFKF